MVEEIDPAIGIPIAIVLWVVWLAIKGVERYYGKEMRDDEAE